MTKQHFEAIAASIKATRDSYALELEDGTRDLSFFPEGAAYDAILATASDLATRFEQINPRFNRQMFLTACGF